MDVNTYMKKSGTPFIHLYEVPSICSNKIITTCIPEVHRVLIKAPIDYVCDLHFKGKSLEHFDESNLCFEDGSWKVCGVKVKDSLSSLDRKRDYIFLHDFIKNLVWEHNPHNYSCEVLDDLLGLLKDERCYSWLSSYDVCYDSMLQNHFAIRPHDASLELIRSFSDNLSYIKNDEERDGYFQAVTMMKRSRYNLGDWTERFDGSKPGLGPAQDCFDFVPDGKVKPYKNTNHGILRFGRNMATHLKDYIGNYTSEFSEKDADLTIMALFQTEMLSFYKLIFQYGISRYFIRGQEKTLSSAGQDTTGSYGGQRNQGATRSSYTGPRRVYSHVS